MTAPLDFKPRDGELVGRIVTRFAGLFAAQTNRPFTQHMKLNYDLLACHTQVCALDLDELMLAGDMDFIHDVAGISRHMNVDAKRLDFAPRYAVDRDQFKEAA